MVKLIVGCGYLGQRIAQRWIRQGETVYGVVRSEAGAAALTRQGIRAIQADVLDRAMLRDRRLPLADTAVYSVAPSRQAAGSVGELLARGLENVLASLPVGSTRWILISSTGVYGGRDGRWVDESSPCQPLRAGGRACLAAEGVPAAAGAHARTVILRLAGIYGPGRIPHLDRIESGLPIPRPSGGHLNLIHVDDAAAAVVAAAQRARRPRIYLVSDGHPVTRATYYGEVARLLGAPPPTFAPPPPGAPASRRALADRKISNRRLLDELQVVLAYPSYREGLRAILGR